MKMCPYLTFDGTARDALTLYARALGGELAEVQRFDEMPESEGKFPPEVGARLAHGQVRFGGQVIMVSDTMGNDPFPGHHGFNIQTIWNTLEEAKTAFEILSEGGEVIMPLAPTFWASAFGICRDRFGVGWMFNSD
ncbi:MAG: VOC family protein [Yoonia sp.]|uniref:VOC family protein n=1 Tax=Yoonia sp. TaxID=2212373 RepID=UPI003266C956